METQSTERFESWAIVELFGHNVMAGFVSEQTIAGTSLLRIDVPEVDEQHPAFTKMYGGAAIYGLTPTTEAHAREAAAQIRVRPVTLYVLPEPKRLPQMSDQDIEGYAYADAMEDDRFDDDDEADYEDDDDEKE